MEIKSLILFLSAIFVLGMTAGCEQQPVEDPLGDSPAYEQDPGAVEDPLQEDLW